MRERSATNRWVADMLGLIISLASLALLALGFWIVMFDSRPSAEQIEILERRLREVRHTEPDHPGVVLQFRRRA